MLEAAALLHYLKEKWLNKQLRDNLLFQQRKPFSLTKKCQTKQNWKNKKKPKQNKKTRKKTTVCFQDKINHKWNSYNIPSLFWLSALSSWTVITNINKTKFYGTPQITLAAIHSPFSLEFIHDLVTELYIWSGKVTKGNTKTRKKHIWNLSPCFGVLQHVTCIRAEKEHLKRNCSSAFTVSYPW